MIAPSEFAEKLGLHLILGGAAVYRCDNWRGLSFNKQCCL